MGKSIFITGGGGYIGSHAAKLLAEAGNRVVIFDNFLRGHKEVIEILGSLGNVVGIDGDLRNPRDLEAAFKKEKIDSVMHFGAVCLVNESMEKPEFYFENNTVGTLNLLEAMRKSAAKKIIFSSTCAVYGESKYLPVDESHPKNPSNPYGESKLLAEKIMRWYGEIYSFKYAILRYFNVCGADPSGMIGDAKSPSELLVQNVVRGALGLEKFALTCPEVDTPDGTPIRDYIDVLDIVDAHSAALRHLERGGESGEFNIGNGRGYSVKEIINEVEKTLGVKIPVSRGKTRKGEYAAIYADARKAASVLGWSPKRSLKESIKNLAKWYTKHPAGYSG